MSDIDEKFEGSYASEIMKNLEMSALTLENRVNVEFARWEMLPKPLSPEMLARFKQIQAWKYAYDALKEEYVAFATNLEDDPSNDERLESFQKRFYALRSDWEKLPLLEAEGGSKRPFPWATLGWSALLVGGVVGVTMLHKKSESTYLLKGRAA